jgi:hypothetical protein
MLCPTTDNPITCQNHIIIRFLYSKIMSAAEIHHELCLVYSQNVMSEGTVRQWCRMFKDSRKTNVNNEE